MWSPRVAFAFLYSDAACSAAVLAAVLSHTLARMLGLLVSPGCFGAWGAVNYPRRLFGFSSCPGDLIIGVRFAWGTPMISACVPNRFVWSSHRLPTLSTISRLQSPPWHDRIFLRLQRLLWHFSKATPVAPAQHVTVVDSCFTMDSMLRYGSFCKKKKKKNQIVATPLSELF